MARHALQLPRVLTIQTISETFHSNEILKPNLNPDMMRTMIPILKTPLGELHQTDCVKLLESLEPESVDPAFADPPFNLGKKYSSKIDDAKASHDYLDWCKNWLSGIIRGLKPGGSLFLWNLPK